MPQANSLVKASVSSEGRGSQRYLLPFADLNLDALALRRARITLRPSPFSVYNADRNVATVRNRVVSAGVCLVEDRVRPSDAEGLAVNEPNNRTPAYDDKRMELTEHLGELRSRIMRSILYLIVGATLAYQFFSPLYSFLYRPLQHEMNQQNKTRALAASKEAGLLPLPHAVKYPVSLEEFNRLVDAYNVLIEKPPIAPYMSVTVTNFWEPFMVRLKVSIVAGFMFVLPLILFELFAFVTPALTPQERKPFRLLIPVSVVLMLFGVAVAYTTMFFAMHWFLSYLSDLPDGANLMQNPNDYVVFFVKMMAAFGIAFQLPVVLMGLGFAGLVTSKGLIKHWRWGVVLAALGGLLTPANDLPSMAMMSIPLLLLYGLSIFLVRIVERMKAKPKPA